MKILNRRLLRELRTHTGRYLALFLMIVLGMYLVVSISGMAETTIRGTEEYNRECNIQDGQFTTFIPLSSDDIEDLSSRFCTIEEIFSVDIDRGEDSLRVFKVRQRIDLLMLDEGSLPSSDNEIVIMNLYAERNGIHTGDQITLEDKTFVVSGIGSVPDYNLTVRNFSDMTADPESFGVAFVTDRAYDALVSSPGSSSESYTYAYKLREGAEARSLKEAIKEIDFDYKTSGNEFLIEYVDRMYEDKTDLEEGLDDLNGGKDDLNDGITEVYDSVSGMEEMFSYLGPEAGEGYSELMSGITELRDGAEEFGNGVSEFDERIREFMDENMEEDIPNLESFYENKDNPRIASDAASDVLLKRLVSLVAGAILVMLFAYVISVFIIHQINEESSVIGTLYALGIRRSALMVHYVLLPTIVTFLAGLTGMTLGFSRIGVDFQMQDIYLYYSLPRLATTYPLYIILYCVVMPPVISVAVNVLVIRKKLSCTALSLIRNEQKAPRLRSEGRSALRKGKGFLRDFTRNQIKSERRSVITVVSGMTVALLIFMIGLNCYVLCNNVKVENIEDISYEYMYILKYPPKTVPEGGEACFAKELSVNYLDYNLNINVLGIDGDNPYFDFKTSGNKKDIVIASSTAQKYDLHIGDTLVLEDTSEDIGYAFTVSDIVDYSIGLSAYLDIDEMRELFGEDEDFFNMVVSGEELDIESGRIESLTRRSDIERAAGIFVDQMMSLIVILISVSILIFIAVMYLMLGVMIDRASFGISLVKIFGYRMREIRKVYLDGNFYAVAAGALIGIPLVKGIADSIYPYFIANTAMGMDLEFTPLHYIGVFLGVILVYLAISFILTGKIKRIVPALVLKNRE